ncbi:DNA-directed DNA polymerase eta rad30 [Podila epicladia]|nr:DNA-directed DNA polymerase eta rad30 [Podila epicladia]KAG0097096.1 DNA-directed DNA polymerase eta rad30 [Podila epicladia]
MNPSSRAQVPDVLKRQKCFVHIDLEQMRLGLTADVPLVSQQWNAIIAVNYAARKFGITRLHHSVFDAKLLCPDLVCAHVATLGPGDSEPDYYPSPSRYTHKVSLDPYRKASAKIFSVFRKHCLTYQKGGLDEIFMDVTDIVNKRIMDQYGDDLSRWNPDTAEMIDWAKDHPEAGVVFGMPKDGSDTSAATTIHLDDEDRGVVLDGEERLDRNELDDSEDLEEDPEEAVGVEAEDDLDAFLSGHPDIRFDDDFDDIASPAANLGSGDIGSALNGVRPTDSDTLAPAPTEETTQIVQEKSTEEIMQEEEAEKERLRQEKEHLLPYYGIPEGTFEERFWAEMQLLKAAEFCNEIRQSVKDELNYTCSAGIANNKLLAKLGSGMNKPFQQTIILPKYIPDLLHGLKLSKIRNLGGKFGKQVKTDYNIERASQLWVVPLRELQQKYGDQAGLELWQWCRGIDHVGIRKIKSKSMCSHKSFIPALSDMEEIQFWITSICLELVSRIQAEYDETERWPRTISLGFYGGIRAQNDQQRQERTSSWTPPHKGSRSMPFGSRFEYGGVEGMARKMYAVVERLIKDSETGQGRPILPLVILTVTVSNFAGGHGSALGDITKFFSKAPVNLVKTETKGTVLRNSIKDMDLENKALDHEQDRLTEPETAHDHQTQIQDLHLKEVAPSSSDIKATLSATATSRRRFFEPRSKTSPLSSPIKCLKRLQVTSDLGSEMPTEPSVPSSPVSDPTPVPEASTQPSTIRCEKCPSPGQHIPIAEWEEHADYHFAMSLLEDDRKQQQIERQIQLTHSSQTSGQTTAKRSASSGPNGSRGKRKKATSSTTLSEGGSSSLARFFKPA